MFMKSYSKKYNEKLNHLCMLNDGMSFAKIDDSEFCFSYSPERSLSYSILIWKTMIFLMPMSFLTG